MANVLIIIKNGILKEVNTDGLDDKILVVDYDIDPDPDMDDYKPNLPNRKLTEEEINFFKNY